MIQWNELKQIMGGWFRWHRFSRAVHWGMRGLGVGLTTVLLTALIFVPWHLMNAFDFIVWVFWASQIGLWGGFMVGFIWPVDTVHLIHTFDRLFGLYERVSTAVEVQRIVVKNLPGKEILVSGWRDRQLADTIAAAKKVKPNKLKPFRWERKTIVLIYGLGLVLLVFWIAAQPQFNTTDTQRSSRNYIKTEIDRIQGQIKEINQNDQLTQEQKDRLTAPYLEAKNKLQKASNSEEALKILDQAEQKFKALNAPLNDNQLQAYQSLGQILGKTSQSPLRNIGTLFNSQDFSKAGQLMQSMELKNLNAQQRLAMVNELNQAGASIRFTNSQLSQKMTEAATALQKGDISGAQTSLKEAGKLIEETGSKKIEAKIAQSAATDLEKRKDVVVQQTIKNTQTALSNQTVIQNTVVPGSEQTGSNNKYTLENGNYESVYSPQISNSGISDSNNMGDSGSESNQNKAPYVELLPAYTGINDQAIENGSVPAYLLPLVRDYLNSLTP